MGYTHYWYRKKLLDVALFKKASKDCAKICRHLGIPIQKEYNDGVPAVFTKDLVRFNGCGEEGHETFYIPQIHKPEHEQLDDSGRHFQFCKTANKSYDIVVTCCLVIFKHYFSGQDFEVHSDGGNADWDGAREQCQSCLGYGDNFKLSRDN